MKIKKSHFRYSKSQRNGIFLLIIIAVVLQGILFFYQENNNNLKIANPISLSVQQQLDSVFLLGKNNSVKIYPFNPNYLSDYKAYQLGMSVEEIDRLMAYRSKQQYVNSAKDFQKVTHVSDSLLRQISPYFKFPDWVVKKKVQKNTPLIPKIEVKDINLATFEDLTKVYGIGEKRAQSILKYRKLIGGYTYDKQLKEVWGIPSDVLDRLQEQFQVLSKPLIQKINVNTASVYELSKIVYIDKQTAKMIIDYRDEVAEIQDLKELKIITGFPVDKYDLISLYLQAQ